MKRFLIAVAVLALLVVLACLCTFQVPETEYAIVTLFGNPHRIVTRAGLTFKWPPPVEIVERIDKRLHVLDPLPAEYLTLDKKNLLVSAFMVWSVTDPLKHFIAVADRRAAEAQLEDILRSEVGAALGNRLLSDLLATGVTVTELPAIVGQITERVAQKAQASLGVHVPLVRLKRINFPDQNRQAVFQRMEAERRRIAMQYRSEGEEEAEKIRADARFQQAKLLADANRQGAEIRGQADAQATRIYAEAYGQDPDFYEFVRTLETYEAILDETSTVIIPADAPLLKVLREGR